MEQMSVQDVFRDMAADANGNEDNPSPTRRDPVEDSPSGRRTDLRSSSFPVISIAVAITQICIFYYNRTDDLSQKSKENQSQSDLSWNTVVTEGKYWSLCHSHLFHSQKSTLWLNIISLLTVGRSIEGKVKPLAFLVIIQTIGVLSSMLLVLCSTQICYEGQSGFTSVNYALRFWLYYLQYPINYEASSGYGFWAHNYPTAYQPWPFLVELFLLKFVEAHNNNCMTSGIIGICLGAGLAYFITYVPSGLWQIPEETGQGQGERERGAPILSPSDLVGETLEEQEPPEWLPSSTSITSDNNNNNNRPVIIDDLSQIRNELRYRSRSSVF